MYGHDRMSEDFNEAGDTLSACCEKDHPLSPRVETG